MTKYTAKFFERFIGLKITPSITENGEDWDNFPFLYAGESINPDGEISHTTELEEQEIYFARLDDGVLEVHWYDGIVNEDGTEGTSWMNIDFIPISTITSFSIQCIAPSVLKFLTK